MRAARSTTPPRAGENIAWNKGYSTTSTVTYGTRLRRSARAGTSPSSGCRGSEPGVDLLGGHRPARLHEQLGTPARTSLGDYDRFGVRVGASPPTGVYYTCVFSKGGPAVAVTDAVLPRVDRARPARAAIYASGSSSDVLRHAVGQRPGCGPAPSRFDGPELKSWTFDGSVRSARVSGPRLGRPDEVGLSHPRSGTAATRRATRRTYRDGRVRIRAH